MDNLYRHNIGLIRKWANRYSGLCEGRADVSFEDLLQIGFFGLVEAKQSYDPHKGSWSSWASYFIRKNMLDALGFRSSKIRYTIKRKDGTTETRYFHVGSLDAPAYSDDDSISLMETIADENIPDADSRLLVEDDSRVVREAVAAIEDEKIKTAVVQYFLSGRTYKSIAIDMDVSPEMIRRLCGKGLVQLRRSRIIRKIAMDRLEQETRYYAHKGILSFTNSQSSVVEDAVLQRERLREQWHLYNAGA